MTSIRSMPCSSCPYRCDVPSGLWAFAEYEKLREYDAPTSQQPWAVFMCHATPDHYCNGWALCHQNRGPDPDDPASRHPFALFALRLSREWDGVLPEGTVPLFASGNDAADHGQRDISEPTQEARDAVARLSRKYPRLREA